MLLLSHIEYRRLYYMRKILIIHGWMQTANRYRKLSEDLHSCSATLYEYAQCNSTVNVLQKYSDELRDVLCSNDYDLIVAHSMGCNIFLRASVGLKLSATILLLSPVYGGLSWLKPLVPFMSMIRLRTPLLVRLMSMLTVYKKNNVDDIMVSDALSWDINVAIETLKEMTTDRWRLKESDMLADRYIIIGGAKDHLINIDKLMLDLPKAQFVMVPNVGHTLVVEDYEYLMTMINSL